MRKIGNEMLLRHITSTKVQQHRGEKKLKSFKSKEGNCLHIDVSLSGPEEPSRWLSNSNI